MVLPNIELLTDLFVEFEDTLASKSVLVGIAPTSLVGVSLEWSYFDNDGGQGLRCQITIELTDDEEVDDDGMEAISDTVSDYLRDNCELERRLAELGVDSSVALWWPVEVSRE